MVTTEPTLVYLITAISAGGLYCLLPRSGRSLTLAGGLIAAAGLAMLLVYVAVKLGGQAELGGYFYLFSTVAVIAAARVVTHPKPVYSALYFILVILSVAGLLLLLAAEFLAIALVIIYAGAILVTYIFVIMLAQQSGVTLYDRQAREPLAAVLVGFLLAATVAGQLAKEGVSTPAEATTGTRLVANAAVDIEPAAPPVQERTRAVGTVLLSRYVVTLEVAGVLLLVAMIGAVMLARRPLPHDVTRTGGPELGQTGREAKPF